MQTQIVADAQLPMKNVHQDSRPGNRGERGTDLFCQAVLFDLDGVLVDSTASVEHAWRVWAELHRLSVNDILAVMHGRRSIETMRLVAPQLATDREAEALNLLQARDTSRDVPVPGALALLSALPALSWAIVTSGPRVLAHARLGAVGLPVPPILVTAEDVTRGKPDPQGYLQAAARLGVPPEHCLVFEDAPVGIAAGQAAGMRVIAVATTYPLEALTLTALAVQTLADVQVKTARASSKEAGHPELVLTISKPLLLAKEVSS
jgi:sugar-phosphatase